MECYVSVIFDHEAKKPRPKLSDFNQWCYTIRK